MLEAPLLQRLPGAAVNVDKVAVRGSGAIAGISRPRLQPRGPFQRTQNPTSLAPVNTVDFPTPLRVSPAPCACGGALGLFCRRFPPDSG